MMVIEQFSKGLLLVASAAVNGSNEKRRPASNVASVVSSILNCGNILICGGGGGLATERSSLEDGSFVPAALLVDAEIESSDKVRRRWFVASDSCERC